MARERRRHLPDRLTEDVCQVPEAFGKPAPVDPGEDIGGDADRDVVPEAELGIMPLDIMNSSSMRVIGRSLGIPGQKWFIGL